jgi:hypothetical protein
VRIVHAESFDNSVNEGLLAKTDASSNVVSVYFDAEELTCRAEVRDLELFRELRLHIDRSFGSNYRRGYNG